MSITKSAKTVDEAVKLALDELNVDISAVNVNVIREAKSGFFGIGSRDALVEVILKSEKEDLENSSKEEKVFIKSDDIEKIERFLKDLISKMGIEGEITFDEDDEALNLYIEKSNDFKVLIGKSGETLDSIQYILNIFARRNTSFEKKVYIDVNGYKKKKEETLREMAMTFAKKAIKYRKVMRLRPMNAYERRIVHSTLYNMKGVFTVSEGDDPYRKVVIKPKF